MDKQAILDHLDIRAFYEKELSSLKKKGKDFFALCPFHDEKDPSFKVDLETGAFHCFGCDKKGSIFDFFMARHEVDFPTAKQALAERAGIASTPKKRIKDTYDYTDAAGNLLFQTVRFEPKDFQQRRPDGKGGWIYNIQDVRLVPFNLPTIIRAETVYIVEGEKDALALKAWGLTATCNPMGALKWKPEYNEYFRGKRVIILADNDEPGRKHAHQVAQGLTGIAESEKLIELPGLPDKGDVSDWIAQGGAKEALLNIINQAPEYDLSNCPAIYIRQIGQLDNSIPEPISFLKKGSDLQALECRVEWAINKLLPRQSITLLHGRGGIGKTWLALIMGNAISKGLPFAEIQTNQMPVIFMDFENSLPVLVERVKKAGCEDVLFWHNSNETMKPPKLDSKEWTAYASLPAGGLLIFDTLRAAQGQDESDSQHMAFIMGRLKDLRDKGYTILLLHHTPKGNDRTYKGSTAILDLADHVLSLHRVKKTNPDEIIEDEDDPDCNYRLGTKDKTRYEPFHIFLTFDPERGFTVAKDPDINDIEAIHEFLSGKGRLNQSQAFELAKKELDIKSKGLFLKLMRKGEDKYWTVEKEGRAHFYQAVQLSYIDTPDNRTIEKNLSETKKTDGPPDSPQTLDSSQLSNCPNPSGTVRTDEEITVHEVIE